MMKLDRQRDQQSLEALSDDALMASLTSVMGHGHRVTASLVAHLVVVEARRLDLRVACNSMFDFCVRKLGMSEGAAFRHINAARLVKRFPRVLSRIECGDVALSTLVLVRDLLSEASVDEILNAVVRKTHREVQELVARRAPKPDAPDRVTRLRPAKTGSVETNLAPLQPAAAVSSEPTPTQHISSEQPAHGAMTSPSDQRTPSSQKGESPAAAVITPPPNRASTVLPLSEDRYRVQFTADRALCDKLEKAKELLRHKHPQGDLAKVIDEALDCLLARLEKKRQRTTSLAPRAESTKTEARPRTSKVGTIRATTRREVFTRDGHRCTFVSESGERCPARSLLELDHIVPRALGGSGERENLRVRCRAHNRLAAEELFGREHIQRAMDFRYRKSNRASGEKHSMSTSAPRRRFGAPKAPKTKPDDRTPSKTEATRRSEAPSKADAARRSEAPSKTDATRRSETPPKADAARRSETPSNVDTVRRFETPSKADAALRFEIPSKVDAARRFEIPSKVDATRRSETPSKADAARERDTRSRVDTTREREASPRVATLKVAGPAHGEVRDQRDAVSTVASGASVRSASRTPNGAAHGLADVHAVHDGRPSAVERAVYGLASMGFSKTAARRAVTFVSGRAPAPSTYSLEELLREALRLLT